MELECLKIVKAPNMLDNFVYLSFLLSSKICAILAPLAALFLLGSLPEEPDMDPCFPQAAGISVSPGILPVLALQTPNHESTMQAP